MAAPQYVPPHPVDKVKAYESPAHVPDSWAPDRPAELQGRQPTGALLGVAGPDQGYALTLAKRFTERIWLQEGEQLDDAVRGAVNVALKRASLFGRAPVIHDLTIAFTIWGFLDPGPPAELVALRRRLFEGVSNAAHHYMEGRAIAGMVPEATLRLSPQQVDAQYPGSWKQLVGA